MDEFVPVDVAIILKKNGFDGPCKKYYQVPNVATNNSPTQIMEIRGDATNINSSVYSEDCAPCYSAPTYEQAIDWLNNSLIEMNNLLLKLLGYR